MEAQVRAIWDVGDYPPFTQYMQKEEDTPNLSDSLRGTQRKSDHRTKALNAQGSVPSSTCHAISSQLKINNTQTVFFNVLNFYS